MPSILGLTNDNPNKSSAAQLLQQASGPQQQFPQPTTTHQSIATDKSTTDKKSKMKPGETADVQPYGWSRKMGTQKNDTISKRNHAAAVEAETLLWRAMLDEPDAAKEYMAEDCVMINPFFGGSDKPMSQRSDPSIDKILEGGQKFTSHRFHEGMSVVEIDLMAVALLYKISLYRQGKKGLREYKATVMSSWRQTAGADWLLCGQHVAWASDDDDEE